MAAWENKEPTAPKFGASYYKQLKKAHPGIQTPPFPHSSFQRKAQSNVHIFCMLALSFSGLRSRAQARVGRGPA